MVYLDYAANTPVCDQVLEVYNEASKQYIANANSPHGAGRKAWEKLVACTRQIQTLLNVPDHEVIYTSGASEANNLAIKGAALASRNRGQGKHIITSFLEHSSVLGAVAALQNLGFEVDYLELTPDGRVDIDNLRQLLRPDTALVSVCLVDSEVGLTQQLEELGRAVADFPGCLLHVDATQAVGKIPVEANIPHLLTFAPHKFYGPLGCGVLLKKQGIELEPLIHGGRSTTSYRSGTPDLPLIAATAKALELALAHREERFVQVQTLNQMLRQGLKGVDGVQFNSNHHSVPHILNLSLTQVKSDALQAALDEREIYVATRSACCAPNTVSRAVYALTRNRKLALSPLRISLSHLTTPEEIEQFLYHFEACYRGLKQ